MEEWKDIVGYEGRYKVSNLGRVSGKGRWNKWGILKQRNQDGYGCVTLWNGGEYKGFRVARLVGKHFMDGFRQGLFINHIDGNPTNNCESNLEWTTPKENTHHAIRLGLFNFKGERNKGSKITSKDVVAIRDMAKNGGIRYRAIGKKFGLTKDHISRIVRRIKWAHI